MKKELVIFETLDKEISLSVEILENTVWLTQNQMAELFKTTKQNISLHANNCFKEGELDKKSVVKESLTTAADGKNYKTKEAFSKYLEDVNLDSRQIYFVNQIIEYIVHNGMMKDLSVLLESPFTDRGSISEIFTDMGVWLGIKKVIDTINANAAA